MKVGRVRARKRVSCAVAFEKRDPSGGHLRRRCCALALKCLTTRTPEGTRGTVHNQSHEEMHWKPIVCWTFPLNVVAAGAVIACITLTHQPHCRRHGMYNSMPASAVSAWSCLQVAFKLGAGGGLRWRPGAAVRMADPRGDGLVCFFHFTIF